MDSKRGAEVEWRDVDLRRNPFTHLPGLLYHLLIDSDPKAHKIIIDEVLQVCREVPKPAR